MSQFGRVPVEAIQDWPRADLLTYTALASTWGKAVTIAEIRKLARIRKQDLLSSLKRLARLGELQRLRGLGGRISYQATEPRGRWVRVPVTVLQDQGLNKTDVLVYIALASFASRWKRKAWPTGETLARRAGVSLRTTYVALSKLQHHHISCQYEPGRLHFIVLKKPKLKRVHVVMSRESELISGYRAAMRGEPPPVIPELYVDTIIEEEEIDTDVG